MARPLPNSPPPLLFLAFSFSLFSRSLSSFLDDDGVNRFDLRLDFLRDPENNTVIAINIYQDQIDGSTSLPINTYLEVVGVELGVGKSLPSLSLPGTASVSIAEGGVVRSSDKLSADPRALLLPVELSNHIKSQSINQSNPLSLNMCIA